MISLEYGSVRALFIGCDAAFSGTEFSDQYNRIVAAYPAIQSLCFVQQVHGDRALWAQGDGIYSLGDADALLSREKKSALLIRTADCIPILFYEQAGAIIGAVHAGWRGLEKKILTKTLTSIENLSQLKFVIGPFIGNASYEVGDDVAHVFPSTFSELKPNGKYWLNLRGVLESEFAALGILQKNIVWHDADTFTSSEWFSARRGHAGRNLALIWRE